MAERYYNLKMEGSVVQEKLNQVSNKLNASGDTAYNLKIIIDSEVADAKYAASQEYVNNAISSYVKLNNSNLKVGAAELNLNNTYLQNTGTKKLKLADNDQVDFGTNGQVLTSAGENEAPVWVNAKVITIEEQIPNNELGEINGVTSIAVDEIDKHKLIVTKESFIKTADLVDSESLIGAALAKKVDLASLCGNTAVLISKPEYVLQVSTDKENQVLKTIKDENEQIKIVWEDEKVFALNIVDDDSSDDSSMPEDAADVVSTLRYEEPNLYVYNERTVNYDAYKAFEVSISSLLGQKAAKTDLENYVAKDELGDQFTMEFDSATKTLTIIRK